MTKTPEEERRKINYSIPSLRAFCANERPRERDGRNENRGAKREKEKERESERETDDSAGGERADSQRLEVGILHFAYKAQDLLYIIEVGLYKYY